MLQGITPVDFELLRCFSAWGTHTGTGSTQAELDAAIATLRTRATLPASEIAETCAHERGFDPGGLTGEEKTAMGRMCKEIIDEGRRDFLARMLRAAAPAHGCATHARAPLYCEPRASPENHVLLGVLEAPGGAEV